MRRRHLIAAALSALAIAATTTPSFAQGPTRTPDNAPTIRIPRGVCGFPVLIKPIADRGIVKTFPDGHMVITGALRETMTNLDSDRQIIVNASGPVRIFTAPNGTIVIQGRGTGWIAEFGGPGSYLRLVHGQTVLDDSGFRVVHGTSRNICPLLR